MHSILANVAIDWFLEGGPIMWPILAALLLAAAVILQRALWWAALQARMSPKTLDDAFGALEKADIARCIQIVRESRDPYCKTLQQGLLHRETSMLGAMQLHASDELARSENLQWILGTLITLAPLLGLLGTITGIMRSFSFVGDDQLAPTKVSGGIAEALIATACGLGIAIVCLIPYNYFNRRIAVFRSRLERTINHVELLAESAKLRRMRDALSTHTSLDAGVEADAETVAATRL